MRLGLFREQCDTGHAMRRNKLWLTEICEGSSFKILKELLHYKSIHKCILCLLTRNLYSINEGVEMKH